MTCRIFTIDKYDASYHRDNIILCVVFCQDIFSICRILFLLRPRNAHIIKVRAKKNRPVRTVKNGGDLMTLLEKIDFLMEKNNLNKKQLSEKSGIPYTTLVSFYKKGYGNMKLSTFKKLCKYLDVSVDSMMYDELEIQPYDPDRIYTTKREREIIMRYRQADGIDQTSIRRTLGIDDTEQKRGQVG